MKSFEDGQAIFEFLVFLPLFIFLSLVIFVFGHAINVSINQQKVTRGYFYYVTANNSFAPGKSVLKTLNNVDKVSQDSIGWREKVQNDTPFAECLALPTFLGGNKQDSDCDVPDIDDGSGTPRFQFNKLKMIRIYTVYGTCTTTYVKNRGSGGVDEYYWMQKFVGQPNPQFDCAKL